MNKIFKFILLAGVLVYVALQMHSCQKDQDLLNNNNYLYTLFILNETTHDFDLYQDQDPPNPQKEKVGMVAAQDTFILHELIPSATYTYYLVLKGDSQDKVVYKKEIKPTTNYEIKWIITNSQTQSTSICKY